MEKSYKLTTVGRLLRQSAILVGVVGTAELALLFSRLAGNARFMYAENFEQ